MLKKYNASPATYLNLRQDTKNCSGESDKIENNHFYGTKWTSKDAPRQIQFARIQPRWNIVISGRISVKAVGPGTFEFCLIRNALFDEVAARWRRR